MPLGKRKPPGRGRLSGGHVSANGFDTPDINLQAHLRKRTAAHACRERGLRDHRLESQLQLVREHWTSVRRLWLDTDAARIKSDLPADFLLGCGMPGLANIEPTDNGRFEFAEDGLAAVIVPAYDCIPGNLDANAERHIEELRDLVAVDLGHPDRFSRRRGEALVLGAAYLEIARQEGEPVPVFKTPVSWLRAGGAGIAILDWAWARDLLLDLELIAEDLDLGDRLASALKPEIWIRRADT